MSGGAVNCLGWIATGVFVCSYFFTRPALLRAVQMFGATLWVVYGILIGASPVIVANLLVFSAAAWTILRGRRASGTAGSVPKSTVHST